MNTSNEAYNSIKPVLPSIREQVYEVIKNSGAQGAIIEEIILAVGFNATISGGGTVNGRPSELAKAGRIKLNGVRKNSRGRNQKCWVATNV